LRLPAPAALFTRYRPDSLSGYPELEQNEPLAVDLPFLAFPSY